MNFYQSFRLAIKSLMASKMRAFLTMLGIIIGVAAVILIVGLGNGMQKNMKDSYKSMGINVLDVNIYNSESNKNFSEINMFELVNKNKNVLGAVSPIVNCGGQIRIEREKLKNTSLNGVAETYKFITESKLDKGRYIKYIDCLNKNYVCIVGSYISSMYYNNNSVGKTIQINGIPYTIIGSLKMVAKNEERGKDNAIFIPYSVAAKINNTKSITNYKVSIKSDTQVNLSKELIEKELLKEFKDKDSFYVMSMAQMIGEMSKMIDLMVLILASIAAISLVVGGIGIMNIMLVSVTERTREIGIRKALGAKRKHIMAQFVIEAGTTSALGGFTGILLGYVLSAMASKLLKIATQTDITVAPMISSVFMAFSISVGIGVLFGYLPAKKAAKLNPIDALHFE